jgi:hypothetical protein
LHPLDSSRLGILTGFTVTLLFNSTLLNHIRRMVAFETRRLELFDAPDSILMA